MQRLLSFQRQGKLYADQFISVVANVYIQQVIQLTKVNCQKRTIRPLLKPMKQAGWFKVFLFFDSGASGTVFELKYKFSFLLHMKITSEMATRM